MGAQSSGPQNPQSRPVWNITDREAGTTGSLDRGSMASETLAALFAFDFGAFTVYGTNGFDKVASGSSKITGPSLQSELSSDYANRKYAINDIMSVGRRGYYIVKIDPAAKPVVGEAPKVSYASGKEGWLTNSGSNSKQITDNGKVRVISVGETTAEVYLDGSTEYEVS